MGYSSSSSAATAFGAGMIIYTIVLLAISIVMIVAMWKLFEKAGKPGWAALVPYYNFYILFDIIYGNGWKMLLLLIPFANFVFLILMYVNLAKVFGKSGGFAAGLIFLSPIFIPILGFGDASYEGPIK
jgi:hypothetical protein